MSGSPLPRDQAPVLSPAFQHIADEVMHAAELARQKLVDIEQRIEAIRKVAGYAIEGVEIDDGVFTQLETQKAQASYDFNIISAVARPFGWRPPEESEPAQDDHARLAEASSRSKLLNVPKSVDNTEAQQQKLTEQASRGRIPEKYRTAKQERINQSVQLVIDAGGIIERGQDRSVGVIFQRELQFSPAQWNEVKVNLEQRGLLAFHKQTPTSRIILAVTIVKARMEEAIAEGLVIDEVALAYRDLQERLKEKSAEQIQSPSAPDFLDQGVGKEVLEPVAEAGSSNGVGLAVAEELGLDLYNPDEDLDGLNGLDEDIDGSFDDNGPASVPSKYNGYTALTRPVLEPLMASATSAPKAKAKASKPKYKKLKFDFNYGDVRIFRSMQGKTYADLKPLTKLLLAVGQANTLSYQQFFDTPAKIYAYCHRMVNKTKEKSAQKDREAMRELVLEAKGQQLITVTRDGLQLTQAGAEKAFQDTKSLKY